MWSGIQNSTSTEHPWASSPWCPPRPGHGSSRSTEVPVRLSASRIASTVPRRSGQPWWAGSHTLSQRGGVASTRAVRKSARSGVGTTTVTASSPACAGTTNQSSPATRAATVVRSARVSWRALCGVRPIADSVARGSPRTPGVRPCSTRRGANGSRRRAMADSKISTHRSASVSESYARADSSAAAPMPVRRSSSRASCSMDSASEARESGATSSPSTPWVMISRGPAGQSYDTTGTPEAMASWRIRGKPSERDDRTQTLALPHSWVISSVRPGRSTRSPRPWRRTVAARASECGPSPQIRRRQSGTRSAINANASMRCANCFSQVRRPALMKIFWSSAERGGAVGASMLGTTTISGAAPRSWVVSQSDSDPVREATTSARGANVSSASRSWTRLEDARCSWCTRGTSGASWLTTASSSGVVVTRMSWSAVGTYSRRAASWRAFQVASQRRGTRTDSREASAFASSAPRTPGRSARGASGSRTSTRCSMRTRGSVR